MTPMPPLTRAHPATPRTLAVDQRVEQVVGMATKAVRRQPAGSRRALSARRKDVLALGADAQMGRVHATAVPAQVVNDKSWRDRADKKFVGEPMCSNRSGPRTESAVASVVSSALPVPAARLGAINESPEANLGRNWCRPGLPGWHSGWHACNYSV